jgi:hypothetical protein
MMKTTGLNFIEAVKAAKEGKKIRRASEQHCYRVQHNGMYYEDGEHHVTCCGDWTATDWEIVPDPPKTLPTLKDCLRPTLSLETLDKRLARLENELQESCELFECIIKHIKLIDAHIVNLTRKDNENE